MAVYWVWAALLVWQNPGLQYDEALLVSGAVHMLRSPLELTIPHDANTWACIKGHCFPLMSVRYVGPIKDYLCLPLFAMFGANTIVIRLVSAFLGSIGIFGLAKLFAVHVGPVAGAGVGLALAMNPTYTDLTVFDNNAVAPMMAGMGLLCLAVSHYLNTNGTIAALGIGAAMGFSVWARANTVWFLVAFCGAAILVLNRRLLTVSYKHWLAWIGGGVLGGLPFLIYQVLSHGGTWQGLEIFANRQPWTEQLYYRFVLFSEMLMSDREHRAMWDGPMMPAWQRWLWPAIFFLSCAVPWISRGRNLWARFASAIAILLTLALFTSRLALSEHHLVAVLPVAIVAAILVGPAGSLMRVVNPFIALIYLSCALFWQISAVRGLAQTGGVGPWSDGVVNLAAHLDLYYPGRFVRILDWGLLDNLYVLSQGRLRAVENFNWPQDIEQGGLFLSHAPGNYQFPEATNGFLNTLDEKHPPVRRMGTPQRNGALLAEIFDVGSLYNLSLTHPSTANQLSGFHRVEETGWRWTERRFVMTLPAPDEQTKSQARLTLEIYVPRPIITVFGSVTLNASLNGHPLTAATYDNVGKHKFVASLPAVRLNPRSNRFEFVLDHALAPSKTDRRELGVIITGASLQIEPQ